MAAANRVLPVYLIHFDRPEWVAAAAATIAASTGITVELTIVDNGSRRGTARLDQMLSDTRVLTMTTNLGYTGAANVALRDWRGRRPDGDYCVVGSHDLHVEPDALAQLVELADQRPDAGIVAPTIVGPTPAGGGVWKVWKASQHVPDGSPGPKECEWASGTCLLLRRECVEAVGPFDERLGSYLEDVDYGLRATDQRWKVLVLGRAHVHGLGSASTSEMWGLRATNTILMNAKRGGTRAALKSYGRLSLETARGAIRGVLPWRDPQRRHDALTVARPCARCAGAAPR